VAVTTVTQESQVSATSTSTAQKANNTGTIVGAAVGVSLGLVALVALLLFFRERKKRQGEKAANLDPPQAPETSTFVYFGSDGAVSEEAMVAQHQALIKYAHVAMIPKERPVTPPRFELSSQRTPELDAEGCRPQNIF
jgi:hypothetical protein